MIVAAASLSSCGFMDNNGMPHQLGGQLAVEHWPDGHYKWVGDFNDSFKTFSDDITQLIQLLGAAWIAGDVAKVQEVTKQLQAKGVSDAQIAAIKAKAATDAATTAARQKVTTDAIQANPSGVVVPALNAP